MCTARIRPLFPAAVLLANFAPAQVFVVDVHNGPGTDFTDLPTAVAAVPDGATLRVRAGTYLSFQLSGKGLSILAEGTVSVGGSTRVVITGTHPGQTVLLRGLVLPLAAVEIRATQGPVVLERCESPALRGFLPFPDPQIVAEDAARLVLHQCLVPHGSTSGTAEAVRATRTTLQVSSSVLRGSSGTPAVAGVSTPGSTGVFLANSRCEVVASEITGGLGGNGCVQFGACNSDGGRGGAGLLAADSTVLLINSTVSGGRGGLPGCSGSNCSCPGSGGDGARIGNCRFSVFGPEPVGGDPGGIGCSATRGEDTVLLGGNQVEVDPNPRRLAARVAGPQQTGATVAFELDAPPGSPAVMLASPTGLTLPLEPLAVGSLLRSVPVLLPPVAVPANGTLALGWTIQVELLGGPPHFGQFVTVSDGRIWASNTFTLAVAR